MSGRLDGKVAAVTSASRGRGAAHTRPFVAELPIPRCGTPEDIASRVLFLASDERAYITGAEHLVDGGLLAGVSRFGV